MVFILSDRILICVCVKVLSEVQDHPVAPSSAAGFTSDPSELTKELQQVNVLLETYLQWSSVEPAFWCWMDSVIEHRSSECSGDQTDRTLVNGHPPAARCSHGNVHTGAAELLDGVVWKLQASLRAGRGHSSRRGDAGLALRRSSCSDLSDLERRVTSRLRSVTDASAPTCGYAGYRPRLQDRQPRAAAGGEVGAPRTLHASELIQDLRKRESHLLQGLEEACHAHRHALQELGEGLDQVVFIPPLKR
ncbi:uncharacterized protein LOC114797368 [Denticeps clupeoides]|uniref:uncharacterized protein LOC114797368 n=1 Tax=Denticeps clupeoides TaxID=299321 RepID=UPI0010A578DA|nr:uncharacterized protein LOC114797368 [Denticeps clupeoides]